MVDGQIKVKIPTVFDAMTVMEEVLNDGSLPGSKGKVIQCLAVTYWSTGGGSGRRVFLPITISSKTTSSK